MLLVILKLFLMKRVQHCIYSFFVLMKKINEAFQCVGCNMMIPPAKKTCRNHCPFCFVSLHVDGAIPWDRSASCRGKMLPINYMLKHGVWKILFKCQKCGKEHRNKVADDDQFDALLWYITLYRQEVK